MLSMSMSMTRETCKEETKYDDYTIHMALIIDWSIVLRFGFANAINDYQSLKIHVMSRIYFCILEILKQTFQTGFLRTISPFEIVF